MHISAARRIEIAEALGLSEQYLYQCLTGRGSMRPADAVRVEVESGGELRRWHLRTKDWHRIWPELIGAPGAPEVQAEAAWPHPDGRPCIDVAGPDDPAPPGDTLERDRELISALGGPAKVADLLRLNRAGGVQRVHNWMSRGIPARVKVEHPEIFMADRLAAPRGMADAS